VLDSGETLPARIVERTADALVAAVIVPTARIRESDMGKLTLEYTNPGGRVRLAGRSTLQTTVKGAVVRIEDPRLLEVVQERAHVRVRAHCPITLVRGHDREQLQTTTVDISGGGTLTLSAGHYSLEDELAFELFIGGGGPPVRGTARVARIDTAGRMGLQFSDIARSERWRLIRYTLECQEHERLRHPGIGQRGAGSLPEPDQTSW
jgi:hypothetical protein